MASSGPQAVMPRIEAEVDVAATGLASNVPGLWAAFVADGDGPRSIRLASITFFGQLR